MGSPNQSIRDTKSRIREEWKKSYPKDQDLKERASRQICQSLIDHITFKESKTICLFASRSWEIDLFYLFEMFPRLYCFPKVNRLKKQLEFYEVDSPHELKPGCFGILEPEVNKPPRKLDKSDLVIVPGFAFDRWGYRIGSGGGYYDRFFSAHTDIPRWGVCYDQQISKLELAHTDQDVRMNAIISECGFFIAKKVE